MSRWIKRARRATCNNTRLAWKMHAAEIRATRIDATPTEASLIYLYIITGSHGVATCHNVSTPPPKCQPSATPAYPFHIRTVICAHASPRTIPPPPNLQRVRYSTSSSSSCNAFREVNKLWGFARLRAQLCSSMPAHRGVMCVRACVAVAPTTRHLYSLHAVCQLHKPPKPHGIHGKSTHSSLSLSPLPTAVAEFPQRACSTRTLLRPASRHSRLALLRRRRRIWRRELCVRAFVYHTLLSLPHNHRSRSRLRRRRRHHVVSSPQFRCASVRAGVCVGAMALWSRKVQWAHTMHV